VGLGADCFIPNFNYTARAYITSIGPLVVMAIIWIVWGLRSLFIGSEQVEKRARSLSQHTYAFLAFSYLVS